MAGGKETPRQKMIGIMYLVLMAMLALNVSNTVLDAFKTVRDGLEKSNDNMNDRLKFIMTLFKNYYDNAPKKAEVNYNKAKEAKRIGEKLVKDIEDIKQYLITKTEGLDEVTGDLKKRDDLGISEKELVEDKKGAALQKKIEDGAKKLSALIGQTPKGIGLELSWPEINPSTKGKQTWSEYNFGEGKPLTSTITLLAKFQNDVKNGEAYVINKLYQETTGGGVVDSYRAVAVAKSSYILQGQTYEANVFLTAGSSSIPITATVNGSVLPQENGQAKYKSSGAKEGIYKWTGTVSFKDPTSGEIKSFTTDPIEYQVAKPSAVVSPTKMNVFYMGVDNPVAVSAPGIPKEKIKVNMTGGTISGANGNYNVRVNGPAGNEVTVNILGEIEPGKMTNLGSQTFRVKKVPDPIATFAGKVSGRVSSSTAKGINNLEAELRDFDFKLEFRVIKFTAVFRRYKQDPIIYQSTDGSFNGDIKRIMGTLNPGDDVTFINIVAKGEDNTTRNLENVVSISIN
ncbi:MAG: gliding motility protein GldM [Bacteroidetes bacterium]|nr:gliding motility protein GldM [Bacteroidota bacterium]MBU1372379.1 gliding motility protein GldM [Bacteroidota bacterium]MBU1483403.1 gliding motility protein GldM [Bacteroidota bacterium]MBU1761712.1 gliding motility protein GldM [Bacteroidota bacterium]MBU2377284.1 gliding motility protein GldM [Bacteroidota bacterium]